MNTYGWDLVSARTVGTINADLAASLTKTPVIVAYEDKAASLSIDATFGPWKIVPGGSNKLLHFEIPVKSGTLKNQGTPFDLTGVVAVIELQLAFIDNVSTANVKDLRFNLKVPGKQVGDATEGAVSLVKVNAPNTLVKPAQQAFGDNLVKCLIANRDKLAYVFANISMDSAGNAKWMAPQRSSYCYLQGAGGSNGYLAILSVLTDRETKDLPLNVDPALIGDGTSLVCSALSAPLFLEHVIMPTLPKALLYRMIGGPFRMVNGMIVGPNIELREVYINGGAFAPSGTLEPRANKLVVGVEGSNVKVEMSGQADLEPLQIDGELLFASVFRLPFQFDPKTKFISLGADPKPEITVDKRVDPKPDFGNFREILEVILTAGLSVMTDMLRNVTLAGMSQAVVTDALKENFKVPDLATSAVAWANSGGLDLNDVGLADALYFRQSEL